MDYAWNFEELLQYRALWLRGIGATFLLSVLVILLGSLLGLVFLAGIRSGNVLCQRLTRLAVDFIRTLPVFVLLSLVFFVVPIATGLRLSVWQCAVLAFSLNTAPFVCEIARASIESVPRVQLESAKILGFKRIDIFRYVIFPQAMQRMMPPLLGEYITVVKLTSLASVIGLQEIWNVGGQIVALTSLTLEARLVSAGFYVLLIAPLIWLLTIAERRFQLLGSLNTIRP